MMPNPDIKLFKPYFKDLYYLLLLHILYLYNIQYTEDKVWRYNFKFNYVNPLAWLYILLHIFVFAPCIVLHDLFTGEINSFTYFKISVKSAYKIISPNNHLYVTLKKQ